LIIRPGHRGDAPVASALVEGFDPALCLADAAYDSDALRVRLIRAGTRPVIPNNPTRKRKYPFDREAYRQRNIIERTFSRLKDWRRVATRYDKPAINYTAAVTNAAIVIYRLRVHSPRHRPARRQPLGGMALYRPDCPQQIARPFAPGVQGIVAQTGVAAGIPNLRVAGELAHHRRGHARPKRAATRRQGAGRGYAQPPRSAFARTVAGRLAPGQHPGDRSRTQWSRPHPCAIPDMTCCSSRRRSAR
jgi:putative transposase